MIPTEIEAGVRLGEVIVGTRAFNPADHGPFRQMAAELKRDKHATVSLIGCKMDELYRCAQRLDSLRKTQPEDSRPIRKEKAEAVRIMAAIDRARERMVAEVMRREGSVLGV